MLKSELSVSSKCQSLRLAAVELHFMSLEKYSLSWNLDCLLFYNLLSDDVLAASSSLLFYPISELTTVKPRFTPIFEWWQTVLKNKKWSNLSN